MFSFSNIGNSTSVEDMYKKCLEYKNNSFKVSSPSSHTCLAYMKGAMDTLEASCMAQKLMFRKGNDYLANTKNASIEQFIMSFIKYAEKQVSEWNLGVGYTIMSWASKDFPCK